MFGTVWQHDKLNVIRAAHKIAEFFPVLLIANEHAGSRFKKDIPIPR
jgi:hypothetical protein